MDPDLPPCPSGGESTLDTPPKEETAIGKAIGKGNAIGKGKASEKAAEKAIGKAAEKAADKAAEKAVPSWIEQLLHGCHPHVAVLDIWADAGLVAPAAEALGIPYLSGGPSLSSVSSLSSLSSLSSFPSDPYDCVLSVLTPSRYASTFCCLALRAWTSLNAGGYMVLVMRSAAYEHIKQYLPAHPRVGETPDGKRHVYFWRKPITKGTRRTPKKPSAASR
jgi:hypothetical protein